MRDKRRVQYAVGDDIRIRELFASSDRGAILAFAHPFDIIGIDEAQQIPRIGLGAKMIIDAFPEKTLILTGSSSFDLSQEVSEPLTGRHYTLTLMPFAQREMTRGQLEQRPATAFELSGELERFLRYGSYPEVLNQNDPAERERILRELTSSYLYKDVLALEHLRSPEALVDIARCVAHQIGSEVSLSEIARTVGRDVKTVARYLDLLEKMFVIKLVRGYSRNLRNEISKKAKYYFLDTGVRNAVIGQFNPLAERNDVGALWENFIFSELYKRSIIEDKPGTFYFWRTHAGEEIDIVLESGAHLDAFECKWRDGDASVPMLWERTYPQAAFRVITRDNYLELLLPDVRDHEAD